MFGLGAARLWPVRGVFQPPLVHPISPRAVRVCQDLVPDDEVPSEEAACDHEEPGGCPEEDSNTHPRLV